MRNLSKLLTSIVAMLSVFGGITFSLPVNTYSEEPDDKPNTPTADSAPLALLGALSLGSLVLMKNRKLNNK